MPSGSRTICEPQEMQLPHGYHRYLGFILTPTGLHMDLVKVAAIQNWLEPWNVHDVQSFLGFMNFYCCFITDYSQMTLPLTNLCKKATPWNFGQREMTAF